MASQWRIREDTLLGARLHVTEIPNGPVVYCLPRPGFQKKYATFAVRYGSIDDFFRLPGQAEPTRVPDGIAHFLEHQMFAQEDGDAFDRFSALGVSANAHTSYTATTYLFSGTENFEPAFRHLLEFVQQPHFTDAGTAKERGIIQQEIRMYDDDPGWRLERHLHANLYQRHPFRLDIAGTVESVGEITTDLLRQCYAAFYHPANAVVAVVGDLDPDRVLEEVQVAMDRHPHPAWEAPERVLPPEPAAVTRAASADRMAVARPLLALGFKELEVPVRGAAQLRRDLLTDIGISAAFGRSSERYRRWYEEGLIDRSFHAGYFGEETFGASEFSAETDAPDHLADTIMDAIAEVRAQGVDSGACERLRRARLGDFVRLFDSAEALGNLLGDLHFNGVDLFTFPEVLAAIHADDVSERLARHLAPASAARVAILPERA